MTTILRLLGLPEVERDGVVSCVSAERCYQLAAYLALRADWLQRDALAELFYPERTHASARSNLRKLLAQLRSDRTLCAQLEERGTAVRWQIETDVAQLQAAAVARDAERVVELYRGPLLEGLDVHAPQPLVEWIRFERDRLHAVWRDAALKLLDDGAERTELAARLVAADPLDEIALRANLRQLARCGRLEAAQRAYDDFERLVAHELGIEPSRDTRELLAALQDDTVPAAAPRGVEGFVGRRAELRTLAALFKQADCRLVTIVGPGGVGKSRLARQALAELAQSLADRVGFVVLDDVTQTEDLGARIARDIDFALVGTDAPLAQLGRHLDSQAWLLVLDGFEQLAGAVNQITWLVTRCQRLRVIVTSRVRLALEREWVLPLEGLPAPEPEDDARAEAFDAVRLYAWHAHRADASFVFEAERAAVAEICRLVEGLPLAIEMAAAWTRLLGCREIAEDLKRGTALLVSPQRSQRQASIDATLEQSWRLLAPAERDVLARLAVFHGGFTREAARQVAGAALPLLAGLVDKSLLRVDTTNRFALHALVAQWLADKLVASGAAAQTVQLHFEFYARMLRRIVDLRGAAGAHALADLEADLGNVLAAWRFGIRHGRADMLASAPALARFFQMRGRFEEGLRCLEAAHEAFGDGDPNSCGLHAALANLEYRVGRYAESDHHASIAIPALRARGDAHGVMNCLNMLGASALQSGRFEASVEHFGEALALARSEGDRDSETAFLQNVAQALQMRGAYDAALAHTQQALALARTRNDRELQLIALNNIGNLTRILGQPAESVAALTDALAIAQAAQLGGYRASLLTNLALAHMDLPDLDAARTFATRALQELRDGGEPSLESLLHSVLGRIATARGAFDDAAREFAAALAWCREHGYLPGMLHTLVVSAERLIAIGARDEASGVIALALRHPATERTDADFARQIAERHRLPLVAVAADPAADAVVLDKLVARLLATAPD